MKVLLSVLLGINGAMGLVNPRAVEIESVTSRKMDRLMDIKLEQFETQRAKGWFTGNRRYSKFSSYSPCVNGKAGSGVNNTYSCNNVDMYSFLSHEDMGSATLEGNDIWGWTSADGREFAAVGQTDGTAFVEVLPSGQLQYVGRLPTQSVPSIWRDIKVINGYAYIGSEATGHGLQVFDMRKLAQSKPSRWLKSTPKVYSTVTDLTAWYTGFDRSHNIVAHEETNMIYAVGTRRNITTCRGGLWMIDVSDPSKPTSPGCVSQDGYVHDAQCVIYKGPDSKYYGKEICFNYNEDTLTIVDVTNKQAPLQISRTPYAGSAYTHQGWLLDERMDILLMDDELDELDGTQQGTQNYTTTYIWDIKSLESPVQTGIDQSPAKSIDHNQYTVNGISYMSNYGSGLRMVDVSSRDLTGKQFKEVGFFDCHPEDDAVNGEVEFTGSWSVYPFFKSGYILLNSIERGVFALKYNPK